jgi:hypothetical protein
MKAKQFTIVVFVALIGGLIGGILTSQMSSGRLAFAKDEWPKVGETITTDQLNKLSKAISTKDMILGVWDTTHTVKFKIKISDGEYPTADKVKEKKDKVKKGVLSFEDLIPPPPPKYEYGERIEKVILTFHPKGIVSSSGRYYADYELLGNSDLRFNRGGDPSTYVIIEFRSYNEMVWYIDNKIFKSFIRVNKK